MLGFNAAIRHNVFQSSVEISTWDAEKTSQKSFDCDSKAELLDDDRHGACRLCEPLGIVLSSSQCTPALV